MNRKDDKLKAARNNRGWRVRQSFSTKRTQDLLASNQRKRGIYSRLDYVEILTRWTSARDSAMESLLEESKSEMHARVRTCRLLSSKLSTKFTGATSRQAIWHCWWIFMECSSIISTLYNMLSICYSSFISNSSAIFLSTLLYLLQKVKIFFYNSLFNFTRGFFIYSIIEFPVIRKLCLLYFRRYTVVTKK